MISYNAVFNIRGETLLFPEILDCRAVIAALIDGLQIIASPHHHSVPPQSSLSLSISQHLSFKWIALVLLENFIKEG